MTSSPASQELSCSHDLCFGVKVEPPPINFDTRLSGTILRLVMQQSIIRQHIPESSFVPLIILFSGQSPFLSICCCLPQPQVWFTVFICSIYFFLYVFSGHIQPTSSPWMIIIDFFSNVFLTMMSFGECLCRVVRGRGKKFMKIPLISVISLHAWKQNRRLWTAIQCTYIPEETGHISPAAIMGTLNLSSGLHAPWPETAVYKSIDSKL